MLQSTQDKPKQNTTNPKIKMSYADPLKLFNVLAEKEKAHASRGGFTDDKILKLKADETYSLRLLWLPSEKRPNPIIGRYVHKFWDDAATSNKQKIVICPTTPHDFDDKGFDRCPICTKASEFWKMSNESESAKELYKKFRRTYEGFVPVYVVKGPEDVKGTVKILQFGPQLKKFLDLKIFDIKPTKTSKQDSAEDDEEDSDAIGINAFMYYSPSDDEVHTEGYNLKITVGSKNLPINGRTVKMNDYAYEFSRKMTTIEAFGDEEITAKMFCKLNDSLSFDDYYVKSDEAALNEFFRKYISGNDSIEAEEDEAPVVKKTAVVAEDEDEEKPVVKKSSKPVKADDDDDDEDEAPVVKKSSKPAKADDDDDEDEKPVIKKSKQAEKEINDDDDIDLDELLKMD